MQGQGCSATRKVSHVGWTTEDGLHESYLVPQFVDGQRAAGVTGGAIPDDRVASGPEVQATDGSWSYPSRPAGEVTGWVVCCECRLSDSFRYSTLIGPVFTRAPSKAVEDLTALRVYATDEDVVFVADREDVDEVAYVRPVALRARVLASAADCQRD